MSDEFILPYKLGFAAVTAAALFSVFDANASCIPKELHKIEDAMGPQYSREETASKTLSVFDESAAQAKEQIEILHGFASIIIENSESLKPEAVGVISKRFWDILA